jgi:hypothetical protein
MSGAKTLCYHRSRCRLWVVPYVRNRLVFAEAAVGALRKGAFDSLLLDLPSFMGHGSWLNAPLSSFPLVSSLLVKEDNKSCSLFPLVPTDAACATAWFAQKRSLSFECVDPVVYRDSSCRSIPSVSACGNERLVSTAGPATYFEEAWRQLDVLLEKEPDSSIQNLIMRGKAVADRIYEKISSHNKVLFLCEYRLWWAVRAALGMKEHCPGEVSKNDARQSARSCALLLEDPYLLWASGLFDDYLTVNRKFQENLQSGEVASFDKYRILAMLIDGLSVRRDLKTAINNVSETLSSLARKIKDKNLFEGTPDISPASLLEDVRARYGAETGNELVRLLMDYPMPTVSDSVHSPPQYFEIYDDKIVASKKSFNLPDVFHANPYGEMVRSDSGKEKRYRRAGNCDPASWLYNVHPVLTRQEAKELGRNHSGHRWAVKADYLLHRRASQLARRAVLRTQRVDPQDEKIGVFTPIAFIFHKGPEKPDKFTVISDSNPTRRQMDLGTPVRTHHETRQRPDSVYSLFAATQSLEVLLEDHIERELIASLTLLFSGSGMGLDRYAAITQQPKDFQCRIRPEDDPELKDFGYLDLGLAWAIKYARKQAIAVAYPGWAPSPEIQEFARRQQKQIFGLSLDVLPEDLTDRLQRLHFISTPLKIYKGGERIISRFIG